MTRLILLLLLSSVIFSQQFLFENEAGKFENASSFSYNRSGFFYVSDKSTNEIYKIDTTGNIIKYAGGYGWKESNFDDPVHVFSTLLNVYVTDMNNHRIEIFDKDLNYISLLSSQNQGSQANNPESASFGYPLGCVISSMGDYYVLDSENKRIIKYDVTGKYLLQFGGYDAGKYSLSNPQMLAITSDNKIFVLDETNLVIFDQFGNGLLKVNLNESFSDISIHNNHLVINNKNTIYFSRIDARGLELKKAALIGYDVKDVIVEGLIEENKLYVLTKNNIICFKMKKAD